MTTRNVPYDVFLICDPVKDVDWAADVQARLQQRRLVVYDVADSGPITDIIDLAWDALAESAALVYLVSEHGSVSPTLLSEARAASGWHHEVYVFYKGEQPARLPRRLTFAWTVPATQPDRLIQWVAEDAAPLPRDQQLLLAKLFRSAKFPLHEFLERQGEAERLTRRFNRLAPNNLSSTLLLRQLIRLRRLGELEAPRPI